MDKWQHELESSVHWDQGDVLIIDVRVTASNHIIPKLTPWQNLAAQHARWAWEGDRKIQASFWDQPGMSAVPIMT